MNLSFETKRLLVRPLSNSETIPAEQIISILSDDVTRYLPPTWQGISDVDKAMSWLDDRIKDENLFLLKSKTDKDIIGFLFLDGIAVDMDSDLESVLGSDQVNESEELRVGYVLSESVWGQGLASELIQSLLQKLKKIGSVKPLVGGVVKENGASAQVLLKNAFSYRNSENGIDFYQYKYG